MEAPIISQEQRKRLDRQRFIGWETQHKLLNSRVLITPANGPNTELAKNLILAGVNITLYDQAITTHDDFQSNFLVAYSDIGRPRAQAVFQRLKEMNPTGKNQVFLQNLLENPQKLSEQALKRYSFVATSTGDFSLMQQWDSLTKHLNIPYYNLVCCGLHCFAFISLGSNYTYKQINKKDNSIAKIWSIKSLSIHQATQWEKANKNKQFIAAIAMMEEIQKQGIRYDPFTSQGTVLEKIVNLGITMVGEKHKQFLTTFAKTYNIDFCPVYSVIGSIISQEVIKIAENQSQPGVNWLVFNSEQGYSNVVKLSTQKERITSSLPQSQ